MSDYTKDARWGGKALQSIFSVILAFAMAFAFNGLSAAQLAHADETINYTVTYVDKDGNELTNAEVGDTAYAKIADNSGEKSTTVSDGKTTAMLPVADFQLTDISGYTFKEITVSDPVGTFDATATNITVGNGATIKVMYEKASYTVTFDTDGGSAIANQTVTAGDKATQPVNPTKDGYRFDGWTLNGSAYDFDTAVTGPITLTATWTQTFTVTFDTDGGSAIANQTVAAGGKATQPATPTKDDYIFKEWTLNGSAYDFDTAVNSNITLIATWTADTPVTKYTVTFDTDGGSAIASQEVAENGKATQPANPTKKGYKFDGWTLNGSAYDFDTAVTGPITLTAKWVESEETYTVTYDLTGGTSTAEKLTFSDLEEGANTPTIANPTREGYTFKGWNPSIVATVTADATYTAQWEARAGNWVKQGNRWWYRYSDGNYPKSAWLAVNGKYYHFDSNGWMQKGWLQVDMNVENQKLGAKSWFFLDSSGAMVTGWKKTGGKWYYMLMANDPQNSDGMNQTGVMIADTTKNIGGKIYSFAKSGAMITGWQSIEGESAKTWFYYKSSGAQATAQWVNSGGKWYWLGEDGAMATSAWVDGNDYYVDANGVMLTGWQKLSNNWYHLNASGKKSANKWIKSGDKWYWLNSGGSMATSAWVDGGNYYVNANGVMLTGWQRIGTNSLGEPTLDSMGDYAYYYFASNGKKIANGWKKSGGNWYWLGENGTMAENSWVGGGDYYVGAKGVMVTGTERIQYDSKGTEVLDKQGRWATYYFNETGKVAANQWVKMGGKWYWFGENGYMIQGAWVNGDKYYVDDEGVYVPNYREDPTAGDKSGETTE